MAITHDARRGAPSPVPVLRRDRIGAALWAASLGAASCFLALVALLAALA